MEQGLNRKDGTRALKIALVITAVFMIVEFAGGLWTNSLALTADAGHMLTDVVALGLSLFAAWFIRRPATAEKTFGYFRVEILAALMNGVFLVGIAVVVFYESYARFLEPEAIKTTEMIIIGIVGLIANLASASVLHGSHTHNLNIRGAFLHVLGDILGSIAVILAGLAISLWGLFWADPAVSALVSVLILLSAWRLVRDSVLILLEGAPAHVNLGAMTKELSEVPGVSSVHDLHVWTLTSGVHVMTCHAVLLPGQNANEILEQLNKVSRESFRVNHTTIQIEDPDMCRGTDRMCRRVG
ncbi:MAG: cation transporter [Acidobacteria bacterium]|nr:MAG: cation transporter [Acidobacteriota bacterium]